MKKKLAVILLCLGSFVGIFAGCKSNNGEEADDTASLESAKAGTGMNTVRVTPTEEIKELEDGLSVVRYEGNYGFDVFLEQGGADSDAGVAQFLMDSLSKSGLNLLFGGNPFGCSTLSVAGSDGGYLFGRNFDFLYAPSLQLYTAPDNGYASVSTVNLSFAGYSEDNLPIGSLFDDFLTLAAPFLPFDGMNEKGLAITVLAVPEAEVP